LGEDLIGFEFERAFGAHFGCDKEKLRWDFSGDLAQKVRFCAASIGSFCVQKRKTFDLMYWQM
jgi:hypothetical protein